MKNSASGFLKQVASILVSIVKAKAMAMKSKTNAMKTRLIIFGLLRNKKVLMSAISHKIHALIGHDKDRQASEGGGGEDDDNSKAIVLYNAPQPDYVYPTYTEEEDDDDYPDLRHSLFEDEDDDDDWIVNETGSVVDLVRNSKEDGSEFRLEDEIDLVADVFIRRFHKQMKMQKQESFKRYKEMLDRSV